MLGIRETHLSIYLNDHLGGSTLGVNLARSLEKHNPSMPELGTLAREIEEDRATLLAVMDTLGVDQDRVKVALSWTAEKASRLKFQGELLGYTALSRFEELETLALGVEGKLALWTALQRAHGDDPRLAEFELDVLAERARAQRRRLEELRLDAAPGGLA